MGSDRSNDRAEYCRNRFQAIRERAEDARDLYDRRSPRTSVAAISSVRARNPGSDGDLYDGLELWDIVHPEILDLVLSMSSCTLEPEDSDEMARSSLLSPTNAVLDLPPHHPSMSRSPSSSNGSGSSLYEIFERLDSSLSRRTLIERFPPSRPRSREPHRSPSASRERELPDDLFMDDVDIDWAALTDILMAQPELIMTANRSAGLNENWGLPETPRPQ